MMFFPLVALSMPGGPEWVFIFFLCLLLFGAKRLPELARGLGKSVGEFQRAKEEIEREIAKAAAPVQIKDQPDKVGHNAELITAAQAVAPAELKS